MLSMGNYHHLFLFSWLRTVQEASSLAVRSNSMETDLSLIYIMADHISFNSPGILDSQT